MKKRNPVSSTLFAELNDSVEDSRQQVPRTLNSTPAPIAKSLHSLKSSSSNQQLQHVLDSEITYEARFSKQRKSMLAISEPQADIVSISRRSNPYGKMIATSESGMNLVNRRFDAVRVK